MMIRETLSIYNSLTILSLPSTSGSSRQLASGMAGDVKVIGAVFALRPAG
jgi:hypothetical protein